MNLTILTCNTLFNKAVPELATMIKDHNPDIIFLQEVNTDESNLKKINSSKYKLADYSNSFIQFDKIYGLATYYNSETLSFTKANNFALSRSFLEIILMILRLGSSDRTVLKTEFVSKIANKKIITYNIHCSVWGTNSARNKQINKVLADLQIGTQDPIVIAGDFNYPYGRKKFESLISKHHLQEATNKIFYTFTMKLLGFIPVKWKNDYILFKNLELSETKKLKVTSSDHNPIVSIFRFP